MKFEFLKLKAYNFVLYKSLEINFRDLEGNLIFITGKNHDVSGLDSNASGKTLIGDLLSDLLFDKTIRRHSLKSFIGKFDKWCGSSLLIRDTVSKERFLVKKFKNHPKFGDKVFFIKIFPNGKKKDLSRKLKKDTYQVISKELGVSWKLFKNCNFFGQDDNERFLQVTDSKKADIIVEIQDLESFQKAKEVSHNNLREVSKKIDNVKHELDTINDKLKMVSVLKREALDKEKALRESIITKKKEISKALKKKKKKVMFLEKQTELFDEKEKELEELEREFEEVKELERNLLDIKAFLSKIKEQIRSRTQRRDRLIRKILQAKKEIGDLKNRLITICSKCGATLTKERVLKSIKTLKKEASSNLELKKSLLREISEFNEEQSRSVIEFNRMKKELKSKKPLLEKRNGLFEELDSLRSKKTELAVLHSEISELLKRKKQLSKEAVLLERSEAGGSSPIEKMEREYKKKKIEKKRVLNLLESERAKNEFSKTVFDRTIRNLFNEFLDNLNHFSNVFLDDICDNNISVLFSPETERASRKIVDKISVLVSVDGSESRDFRTYSKGERSRIELVTQLSLFSSSRNPFPFLFLDEPMAGLDKTGREKVFILLRSIADEGNKVFVVSNKVVPQGYGSIIEVIRDKGQARLSFS